MTWLIMQNRPRFTRTASWCYLVALIALTGLYSTSATAQPPEPLPNPLPPVSSLPEVPNPVEPQPALPPVSSLPEIPNPVEPQPVMIDPGIGALRTGSGRFGQAGPADRQYNHPPEYFSRETPLFVRFREALQYDQPTWQRSPISGAGRFGQANALDYGDIEEGPGFIDVLFPERVKRIRERLQEQEGSGGTGNAPPEPSLPPTLLTRLNQLFLNQVLADATLPFSIRNPGPDSANFPNSAYTLERGHVYIETQP
ncbi:MAG: hypothetical protein RJA81_1575, partial [Planctomycetota bacterium]